MKRKTKWFFAGAGVSAVTAFTLGIFAGISKKISNYVVNSALDREIPKPMRGARNPNNSKIPEDVAEKIFVSSEKLKNSNCETVTIYAGDGEKLVGHWIHKDGNNRVIIAMHGWRSSWHKDFGAIDDFWRSNNCSILYAEQRGQGRSGGQYMGFGMIERFDCLEWINWVNNQTSKSMPVYLAGISMGASTVLMAGGFELPENVKGIMADCGFTSAHAIWKHVVEDSTRFSYNSREKAVDNLCRKKINIGTQHYSTIDAMKDCITPVLFVHGTDDTFVPVEMTYENYMVCNAPKRLFIVPGATHAMSYFVDKEGYEKHVKEFWDEFDK